MSARQRPSAAAVRRRIEDADQALASAQAAAFELGVGERWRKYCHEKTREVIEGLRAAVNAVEAGDV